MTGPEVPLGHAESVLVVTMRRAVSFNLVDQLVCVGLASLALIVKREV